MCAGAARVLSVSPRRPCSSRSLYWLDHSALGLLALLALLSLSARVLCVAPDAPADGGAVLALLALLALLVLKSASADGACAQLSLADVKEA
jgi:hypothetical protein